MKNAANNGSDKISHTQCTRGDEESAPVIIEFSVWRKDRGWVRWLVKHSQLRRNPLHLFSSSTEFSQDLRGAETGDVVFLQCSILYLLNKTPMNQSVFLVSRDCSVFVVNKKISKKIVLLRVAFPTFIFSAVPLGKWWLTRKQGNA